LDAALDRRRRRAHRDHRHLRATRRACAPARRRLAERSLTRC
jgi:hypothetical protein